ncbi:MAG TPA: PH domain-containing protein [Actinomycetota bacterium]|nr:PH domain-containing protein [Actinomycetota bacterium]
MAFPRRLLSEGEDLVLDVRQHWIALVWPLVQTALILAALIAALIYVPDSWSSWFRWLLAIAAVGIFAFGPLPNIVQWATSHFVVTTDRLIHRSGLVAKKSMEIPLEKISDVRFSQGVFERMIGAGDLVIESPGEFGQETFSNVRRPEEVQKLIYEMGEANQQRMTGSPARGSVTDELERLARLRDQGVLTEEEFRAQKARLLGS